MSVIIRTNCAIVSVCCVLALAGWAAAQPVIAPDTNKPAGQTNSTQSIDTPGTNQPPSEVVTNAPQNLPQPDTNISNGQTIPNQSIDTSGTNPPPSEVVNNAPQNFAQPATNIYGAQIPPYQFESQNNLPVAAGPTYLGSGQVTSHSMGTSIIGGGAGFVRNSASPLYTAGKLIVHASLSDTVTYATGILALPGQRNSVIVESFSPTLSAMLGDHWSFYYSISLPSYTSGSNLSDSIGHSFSLSGSTIYEGWSLGLTENYSLSDTSLVETGTQTSEEAFSTGLTVSRALGERLNFVLGLNEASSFAAPYNDVNSWGVNGSLNYVLTPRLTIGASASWGYDDSSLGTSGSSESYQAVLMFHPATRATLNVSGGVQVQNFNAGGVGSLVSPSFSASLSYLLGRKTTISINAGRSISPSFFSNQVSTGTSFGVGIQYMLSPKLNLGLSAGYSDSTYDAILPGAVTYNLVPVGSSGASLVTVTPLQETRNDSGESFAVSVSYLITPRINTGASYSYSENKSSVSDFTYSSSQVTFSLTYSF